MLRNKTIRLILVGMLAVMGFSQAAGAAQKAGEKIVIQVSDGDPRTWNQALNVVKNLQQAYGKTAKIEVVVFGNGIGMLKMDSEVGNRISETLESGAAVNACQNTMRGRKLTKDDMLPAIGYVPAGIVEIITRQRQGWAVVRP
ncbi:MAG TPA: DsrE family protein [Burkholderiales bacterium]|nr:DsrE family protein [Burkholderiales bacterium]